MLITALIIFSQFSFAQATAKKNVRMSSQIASEAVEKSATFKRIEKLQADGKFLTDDPKLAKHVAETVDTRLTDIVKVDSQKLMNLINIDPKLTLAKIFELSSIFNDPNATPAEKAEAKKALELLFVSADGVNSTAKNQAEATSNRELLKSNISLSEKVATFIHIKGAEKFVAEYAVQLEKGKSAVEAISIAGKGKGKNREDITEEQVKNCSKG